MKYSYYDIKEYKKKDYKYKDKDFNNYSKKGNLRRVYRSKNNYSICDKSSIITRNKNETIIYSIFK